MLNQHCPWIEPLAWRTWELDEERRPVRVLDSGTCRDDHPAQMRSLLVYVDSDDLTPVEVCWVLARPERFTQPPGERVALEVFTVQPGPTPSIPVVVHQLLPWCVEAVTAGAVPPMEERHSLIAKARAGGLWGAGPEGWSLPEDREVGFDEVYVLGVAVADPAGEFDLPVLAGMLTAG
jgi:hypothetical protein